MFLAYHQFITAIAIMIIYQQTVENILL